LKFLEEKLINNLDYNFLQDIKSKLPYNHAYFLVCMVEVLNEFIDERKTFISFDDALQSIIDKASELYLTTNISSVFQIENLLTH